MAGLGIKMETCHVPENMTKSMSTAQNGMILFNHLLFHLNKLLSGRQKSNMWHGPCNKSYYTIQRAI